MGPLIIIDPIVYMQTVWIDIITIQGWGGGGGVGGMDRMAGGLVYMQVYK